MVFRKSSLKDLVADGKSGMKVKFSRKVLIVTLAFLGLLVALSGGGYFYMSSQAQKNASVNGKLSENQIKDLLEEVGSKIDLPKGETPTIATVTDITKLGEQPFFKKAINGDKVIIYGSTQKAILYRQSAHKIIDVAQINVNTASQGVAEPAAQPVVSAAPEISPSITPTPTEAAKRLRVVILNSTRENGLAKKGSSLLDTDISEVVKTSNAIGEYDDTTISSVAKGKKITDKELKSLVSGFTKVSPAVVALPSDEETPPDADIVIILGNDFSEAY